MPKNHKAEFIKIFNSLSHKHHKYEVFRDFCTMASISIHNALVKKGEFRESLEKEFLLIEEKYSRDERDSFSILLVLLVEMLEPKPCDILGGLYMDLDLGNDNNGQYFTPPEISELMAMITLGDSLDNLDDFITLSEPACGAGGMVLAFVDQMIKKNHNPQNTMWVQCWDIDRNAALMCFLQLSLWNVPAEVIVGNTLSLEVREVFYTPAHYMGNWAYKLACRSAKKLISAEPKLEADDLDKSKEHKPILINNNSQFDFGF